MSAPSFYRERREEGKEKLKPDKDCGVDRFCVAAAFSRDMIFDSSA
jgi:hypothetical protein